MPDIQLTDELGLDIEIKPSPTSALVKYFKDLPKLVIAGKPLKPIAGLTLADPAITTFQTGLNVAEPVPVGLPNVQLALNAGVTGALGIFVPAPSPGGKPDTLFGADEFGEDVPVAQNERYVSTEFTLTVGPSVAAVVSDTTFGFAASSSVSIANYRKFSIAPKPPTILDAVEESLSNFQLPGSLDDLNAMDQDSVIALSGSGNLQFSATANLLTAVNPLAAVDLPSLIPLQLNEGPSITVGASFALTGRYQIRVHKTGPNTLRLGYFREHGSQFDITADASAGVSLDLGTTDLFAKIVTAISPNATADLAELKAAKIDDQTASAIHQTVKASIQRSLEVALSFELGGGSSSSAAFLYEIDLVALDQSGRAAVQHALHGNLTDLVAKEGALPAGITAKKSIFTNLRQRRHSLKINLLGIYNFISVSQLTLKGVVMYDDDSGQLVLTDSASASKMQAGVINVGGKPNHADPAQLRSVLASSFLITATYRAAGCVIGPPALKSSQIFSELHASTNRQTMQDELDTAVGLGLMTAAEKNELIAAASDFGRTIVYAHADYDDALTAALFLNSGAPRSIGEYETIGRTAMQIVIHDDTVDPSRLQPLQNDDLWRRMKQSGPTAFRQIFPSLDSSKLGAITADYLTIVWWAKTMAATAEKLARIRQFATDATASKQLRADLANHLRSVAADTRDEFGRPWGLIAMDIASGNKSAASVVFTGPVISWAKQRTANRAAG